MWRLTRKSILAQKLRLFLTGFAILVGVAFISGSFVFGDTLSKGFDELFAGVYKNTDVVVQSSESASGGARPPFPASVLEEVRSTPGVDEALGGYYGTATLIKADGDAVVPGGPPTQGFDWVDSDLNPFTVVEGHAPEAGNQIVIDEHTAEDNDFAVGQTVRVIVPTGTESYNLVGIVRFGDGDSLGGTTNTLFTPAEAERVFRREGLFDTITVAGSGSQEQLRDAIAAKLPPGVEAVTGTEAQDDASKEIKDALSILTYIVAAFGFIAVFVAAFTIFNTFSITIAQRARQLALLRAVGASSRQVRRMVLLEALVVGVIASVLGLLAGFGVAIAIRSLFTSGGIEFPGATLQLEARTIWIALVVGIGITVIAALMPAIRASRLPPMAALRDDVSVSTGSRTRRLIVGVVVTVLGALSVAFSFQGDDTQQVLAMLGAGVVLLFVGVAMLAPLIARPLAGLLGAPLLSAGVPGKLGRGNAMRNPQRTAQTASALMIGISLVTLVTIFAFSLSASFGETIDRQLRADVVAYDQNFTGFPPAAAEEVARQSEVGNVAELRGGLLSRARILGDYRDIGGADPAKIEQAYDPEFISGGWDDLTPGTVAITEDYANDHDLQIGSKLDATFDRVGERQLTVGAIYKSGLTASGMVVPMSDYEQYFVDQTAQVMFINGKPGNDPQALYDQVKSVLRADYPSISVRDQQEYKEYVEDQVNQLLIVVFALLALAVIVAIFGIVNTLALSVFERTREIGLLRAVGLGARQARAMIRWESVIVALIGGLLGVVLGLVFGAVAVQATPDLEVLSIPWLWIAGFLVFAGVVGVFAAIWPARRAARLNVLRAIAHE